MIVVELTYKKPIEEVDQYLIEHRKFLQNYYDKGILIVSGPQNPRSGGILLAKSTKNAMEEIIKEDPFYRHGIANYRVIEFDPVKFSKEFEVILAN